MANLFDPRGLAGAAPAAPHARYILPQFTEQTSYGVKTSDPYNKLFEERIIFLGNQVDDVSANDLMAQLLVLESQDPDRDITMYINSPGGSPPRSARRKGNGDPRRRCARRSCGCAQARAW
ncbi:ATP-dependent Clp protease proteolytic subunit, partial [Rhodococcus triatomae]